MPIVRIDLWKGRQKDQKKALVKNVTRAVSDSIGCPLESVQIIINDVEKDDWGIGGELCSEKFPGI